MWVRVEHFPGVSGHGSYGSPWYSPPRKNFNTEEEFRTFLGNAEARQSSLTEVGTPPLTLYRLHGCLQLTTPYLDDF